MVGVRAADIMALITPTPKVGSWDEIDPVSTFTPTPKVGSWDEIDPWLQGGGWRVGAIHMGDTGQGW